MSTKIRKIITIIAGVLLATLLVVGAYITIRLSQETQNDLSPDPSFAAWCAGDDQCPAAWRTGNSAGCSEGTYQCIEPGQGGGGGGTQCKCDNWAEKGSEHCNPGLNKIYRCSDSCNWIDTGKNCQGQVVTPPPTTQCGDNRCEGNENGTNCPVDCGTSGTPGGGGTSNVCSGPGNNQNCTTIGQVVNYGGGTCICQRSIDPGTTNQCSCVNTNGTLCAATTGNDGCTSLGASCVDSQTSNGVAPTNRTGSCISTGVVGGQQQCRCNPAPNVGQGTCGDGQCNGPSENSANCSIDCGNITNSGNSCNLDSDCPVGQYCTSGQKVCQPKVNIGSACGSSNQCLSGNCVFSGGGGTCQLAGTGNNSCSPSGSSCSNPVGGGTDGFCNNGNCIQKGDVNASCVSDSACKSGLVCLSLRCRQPVDDSNPNNSCISGKWYCYGSNGMSGGAPGQGQLCSNGKLSGVWETADACASTSNQQVSQGMSCSGLKALSGGEALNGIFVGCSGRLNCFCGSLNSSSTVNCIPDVGNDSCGASGITPIQTTTRYVCNTSTYQCEARVDGTGQYADLPSCDAACNPPGTPPAPPPSNPPSGPYCGDGVFTPSIEACDPTAPVGNGNSAQCNANCTLQQIANQCIDLVENGVDPITAGTGNYMVYTLVYQHSSATNPYPNIRLRVGPSGSPVGRDANSTGSTVVAPIPGTGYTYDPVTSRHTYRFRWEAANPAGTAVSNGTYDVRVMLDGSSDLSNPAACTEQIQVQSTAEQQPLFTLVKQSAPVCVADGSVQINYTITVTNVGPVQGVIDFVRDQLDERIVATGITPTNINPGFGTYSAGVITWIGSSAERTFTPGQSKQYTYTINIPSARVTDYASSGVYNQASVQFDTTTTTDNTDSFDVRTPISCTSGSLPQTSIFDDGRFLLIGLIFTILGIFIYRADITKKVIRPLEVKR